MKPKRIADEPSLSKMRVNRENRELLQKISTISNEYYTAKDRRDDLIRRAMINKIPRHYIASVTGLTESYLYKIIRED